jgi:hypothetical protein
LVNHFSKTNIIRTPKPDEWLYAEPEPYIFSDNLRAGLNIGLGMEYLFFKSLSIDLSAKYNFMNLIGKEEKFNMFTVGLYILYAF